jgi:DNA-binding CsgD family transcriptional regulator
VLLGLAGDDPAQRFARAEELDRQVRIDAESSAPVMLAVCLIRMGRLDDARPRLLAGKRRASAEGDERSHSQICLFLAELEWLAGDWDAAAAYSAEGMEIGEQAGLLVRQGSTTGFAALVEASRGDAGRARATAERGIALSEKVGDIGYVRYSRQILAFLDLSLGDATAAARSLDTYVVGHAIEGPKRIAFIGDAIEALVQLGDIDRAAALTDEVAARGTEIRRPPMIASASRCRALVLASRGQIGEAIANAEEAIGIYEGLRFPMELARARLVLGEVQRRAKQRKAARETLDRAIAGFEALGAHLWVDRARAEQARIGGRTTIEGLTETELRVAQLVAEGRSNKEVAAALFVSVRAVEANLSRVYAKLGIESRTELARRL